MRKIALFAAAAVAMAAVPAVAAPAVNINLQGVSTSQVSQQDVNQLAGAAAIAVGAVNDSTNEASAIAGNNLSNVDATVKQTSWLGNGNVLGATVGQATNDVVNQASIAIAGAGGLSAGSVNSAMGAALNNQAGVTVSVTQN